MNDMKTNLVSSQIRHGLSSQGTLTSDLCMLPFQASIKSSSGTSPKPILPNGKFGKSSDFQIRAFFWVVDMSVPRRVGRGIPSYLVCCFFSQLPSSIPCASGKKEEVSSGRKKLGIPTSRNSMFYTNEMHGRKQWTSKFYLMQIDFHAWSNTIWASDREIILRSKTT